MSHGSKSTHYESGCSTIEKFRIAISHDGGSTSRFDHIHSSKNIRPRIAGGLRQCGSLYVSLRAEPRAMNFTVYICCSACLTLTPVE